MANNTNNTQTVMSIDDIINRKLPPIVKPGKYDNVEIKETKKYPKSDTNKQEFLRITYKTADGREISENRFPQGLNILISHLREQLKMQDQEVDVAELIKPGAHKFTIWVEKVQTVNRNGQAVRVTNIHFLEPLKKPETEAAAEAETIEVGDELPE